MRKITRRSFVNVNNAAHYNLVDARQDNRHLPERELMAVVRAVRADQDYRYTPLRSRLK